MRFLRNTLIACLSLWLVAVLFQRWYRLNFNWPFVSAAGVGNIQFVRAELDAGVPPDRPHWQGASAMSFACSYGQAEVVKLLLARGANPNGFIQRERARGHDSIVRLLKAAGAKD